MAPPPTNDQILHALRSFPLDHLFGIFEFIGIEYDESLSKVENINKLRTCTYLDDAFTTYTYVNQVYGPNNNFISVD